MSVSMARVAKYRSLFIQLQKKHGVREIFNVNDAKWTLRDIMDQIDDERQVEALIKFFFIMSDSKTWDDFQYNYEDYLNAWNAYRESRRVRAALQEQTINRRKRLES